MAQDNSRPGGSGQSPVFATTHWSVVLAAGDSQSPQSKAALEELCRAYWTPLYVFARRRGYSPQDAEDVTQGFFERLIERGDFRLPNPERGRFRSFLLTGFKNFMASKWREQQSVKRGGGIQFISRDAAAAEGQYLAEPVDGMTPDRLFERRWAMSVLEQAVERFETAFDDPALLAEIRPLILGGPGGSSHAVIAEKLGIPVNTVKSHVHRARQEYREVFRRIVAATVDDPTELDVELRELRAALSRADAGLGSL